MDFGKWELFIPPGPDGFRPVSHGSKLKVSVSKRHFIVLSIFNLLSNFIIEVFSYVPLNISE